MVAAQQGEANVVSHLVGMSETDLLCLDHQCRSVLAHAIGAHDEDSQISVATTLLEAKASLTIDATPVLLIAVESGGYGVLESLLLAKAQSPEPKYNPDSPDHVPA